MYDNNTERGKTHKKQTNKQKQTHILKHIMHTFNQNVTFHIKLFSQI